MMNELAKQGSSSIGKKNVSKNMAAEIQHKKKLHKPYNNILK